MNMDNRIETNIDKYLRETYPEFKERDWKTNVCTMGRKKMYTGEVGDFMKIVYENRENRKKTKKAYFIDKNTLIKSKANLLNCSAKQEHEKAKGMHVKKPLCYTEIDSLFPFEIFENLEEPRIIKKGKNKGKYEYNRGFEIVFDNKETTFSNEAEEFYNNECDKHKLNLILYAINRNIDKIKEHRWTLQMFSRVAYVAMCTYYGREWNYKELYNDNDKVYSLDSMIFSTLICKCFTARCSFYNIVDELGEDWDWPDDEKSLCECPASCRSLPVTHDWRNRWDNDYLLELIPKEAKTYWKRNETDTAMDD